MISNETLEKLAKQYQTGIFPNIIREYCQHIFLNELYKCREQKKCFSKAAPLCALSTAVLVSPRI